MGKFFLVLIILFSLASLVFAASQKSCNTKLLRGQSVQICEPATPVGKWIQTNLGISF